VRLQRLTVRLTSRTLRTNARRSSLRSESADSFAAFRSAVTDAFNAERSETRAYGQPTSMLTYLVRRVIFALVLVITVSSASLLLTRWAPGDYATTTFGLAAGRERVEAM